MEAIVKEINNGTVVVGVLILVFMIVKEIVKYRNGTKESDKIREIDHDSISRIEMKLEVITDKVIKIHDNIRIIGQRVNETHDIINFKTPEGIPIIYDNNKVLKDMVSHIKNGFKDVNCTIKKFIDLQKKHRDKSVD